MNVSRLAFLRHCLVGELTLSRLLDLYMSLNTVYAFGDLNRTKTRTESPTVAGCLLRQASLIPPHSVIVNVIDKSINFRFVLGTPTG